MKSIHALSVSALVGASARRGLLRRASRCPSQSVRRDEPRSSPRPPRRRLVDRSHHPAAASTSPAYRLVLTAVEPQPPERAGPERRPSAARGDRNAAGCLPRSEPDDGDTRPPDRRCWRRSRSNDSRCREKQGGRYRARRHRSSVLDRSEESAATRSQQDYREPTDAAKAQGPGRSRPWSSTARLSGLRDAIDDSYQLETARRPRAAAAGADPALRASLVS